MKTAGVVFDFYDDASGTLLKAAFPTPDELPEIIKEAHILNSNERDVLRDEAYALVMSNNGHILRKFACVDAGNTLLSCLYFEENAQKLPEEAVKVAAVNLASFCEDFGFEPTNFVKMAAATQSRTRDSMRQPIVGDEADWAQRTNLVSVRGGADSGRVIPTANQMKTAQVKTAMSSFAKHVGGGAALGGALGVAGGSKKDENGKTNKLYGGLTGAASGGFLGASIHSIRNVGNEIGKQVRHGHTGKPLTDKVKTLAETDVQKVPKKLKDVEEYLQAFPQKEVKASVQKLAGGQVLTDDKKDNGPEKKNPDMLNRATMKDKNTFAVGTGQGDLEVNYKSLPKIAMVVDVSNKEPVHRFEKRASKRHALGTSYPLDSYQDVKAAAQYFDDYYGQFNPADRHEYAVKTASRADELGIATSELLQRYGSTEYAPDIDAHLASRKAAAPMFGAVYDAMREKRAEVSPEVFVELLQKVDEEAGLNWYYGGDVTDPYLATFGGKEKAAASEWAWEGPNGQALTAEHLQGLAESTGFKKSFDQELVSEFCKDPTTIFDSLPNDTKNLMARMALSEE